jgi:hypothetical protein
MILATALPRLPGAFLVRSPAKPTSNFATACRRQNPASIGLIWIKHCTFRSRDAAVQASLITGRFRTIGEQVRKNCSHDRHENCQRPSTTARLTVVCPPRPA